MMAAVHPVERAVVDGLEAVFDRDIRLASQFLQQIEHIIRHAVWTGADCQTNDMRVG